MIYYFKGNKCNPSFAKWIRDIRQKKIEKAFFPEICSSFLRVNGLIKKPNGTC